MGRVLSKGRERKGRRAGTALGEGPQPKALHRPGCPSEPGGDPSRAAHDAANKEWLCLLLFCKIREASGLGTPWGLPG